ncbi:hypothetical protein [Gemmata obscuriglobus]|uniref:Uncharacterized protein n=1 Tax=Gemmata obscuriglobus TaxID=114 RepID=A0A2Z3GSR6_9BACT|nr:hypothetical protein [Gemmata obscuriglobus]AWM35561.1 hypothetical protein C1280_00005 [Gemmata obscuriglobus]
MRTRSPSGNDGNNGHASSASRFAPSMPPVSRLRELVGTSRWYAWPLRRRPWKPPWVHELVGTSRWYAWRRSSLGSQCSDWLFSESR